jgi:hypothetical protein
MRSATIVSNNWGICLHYSVLLAVPPIEMLVCSVNTSRNSSLPPCLLISTRSVVIAYLRDICRHTIVCVRLLYSVFATAGVRVDLPVLLQYLVGILPIEVEEVVLTDM